MKDGKLQFWLNVVRSLGQWSNGKLILMLSVFAVFLTSAGKLSAQNARYTFTEEHMGTYFSFIIYSEEDPSQATEQAFQEVERINSIFSTYIATSEVSKLNFSKKWMQVSDDLIKLIHYSEAMHSNSDSAFDIKVGLQTIDWRNNLPTSPKLSKKRKIKIRKNKVKTNKHTLLDFGAIAKGYAVDRAFNILKQLGFDTVLVDGGGDMRVGEPPPNSEGWKIGLFHENNRIIHLSNCAIATSGPEEKNKFKNGEVESHIIDPRTSEHLKQHIGVTVISDECMQADALATAISVLGSSKRLDKHYQFKSNIKKGDDWIFKQF